MNIDNFERLIADAEHPLVIDFWADWCVPCRMMEPALKRMEEKYQNQVEVVRINTDESQELIRILGIQSIPTLMGYRSEEVLFRVSGIQPTAAVAQLFARLTGEITIPGGPNPLDRILRVGGGLILAAIGIANGPLFWLIGLGGLVIFSAVYDRCPIYNSIAPRIKALLKR